MAPLRVVVRLLSNVSVASSGCIESLYSVGSHGYSQIGWHERSKRQVALGHRVAWEAAHGPIPNDLTVDHLCRNRRCINTEHMRLLSNVDNARLNGPAMRTHCPHGHEYSEANTRRTRRGHRRCIACEQERNRLRYAA